MCDATQQAWERLHGQPRFLPRYPAEDVVRFTFSRLPRPIGNDRPVILDLGCGGGRHTLFFAREGYRAVGSDFSRPALLTISERLEAEGFSAGLCLADARTLPFVNESFDGVVAYGSLYYMHWEDMRRAAKEIKRVLRPGGSCLVVTRTDRDHRRGRGRQIDMRTYLLDCDETNEAGMLHCFITERDIPTLLEGFVEIVVDRNEFTTGGGRILNSDWVIMATKGAGPT